MESKTIFSKTAKGLREASGASSDLPRATRAILKEIDGKKMLSDLCKALSKYSEADVKQTLQTLESNGYIRDIAQVASTVVPISSVTPEKKVDNDELDDLDFTSLAKQKPEEDARRAAEVKAKLEAEQKTEFLALAKAKQQAEEKARRESIEKARHEAAEKAKQALLEKAKLEAAEKARQEALIKVQREAELRAKKDAEERARREAQEKARREVEERTRRETEQRVRREAAEKAKREAEERAQKEAEARAKREQEERAKEEAAEKLRLEAREKARMEAVERTRREAAEAAQREAEEKLRRENVDKAKREAEEKSRRELAEKAAEQTRLAAEAQARREAEDRQHHESEERAKREAAEKDRVEAEARARSEAAEQEKKLEQEKAQREADERAKRTVEEQAQKAAEEKARLEAEARAREEAEERVRQEAAENAQRLAEERVRKAAEEKARLEAEARARQEAEEQARREAEDKAKQEAEEKARLEREAKERRAAEEKARLEAEGQARLEAEKQERLAAWERSKQKAEEKLRLETEEKQRRAAEEQARREEAERVRLEEESGQSKSASANEQVRSDSKLARWIPGAAKVDSGTDSDELRVDGEELAKRKARLEAERKVEELTARRARQAAKLADVRWGKLILMVLIPLAIVALVRVHVVSFDDRIPGLQKAASEQIGQPVKIDALYFSLYPRPHWRLEGVSIGNGEQILVQEVNAVFDLGELFSNRLSFNSITMESPLLKEEAAGWLFFGKAPSQATDRAISVSSINAHNVAIDSRSIRVPSFDAKADIGPDGNWQKIALDFANKEALVQLHSDGDRVEFNIDAITFLPPFGGTFSLDDFTGKGSFGRKELVMTAFEGRNFGGKFTGTATLNWADGWRVDGTINAKQPNVKNLLPTLIGRGYVDGKATFSMRANDAKTLFSVPHLEGSFVLGQGILLGIDLMHQLQKSVDSGKTEFRQLNGSFVRDGNVTQLRAVRLDAGMLTAAGSAEFDADGAIHGRFGSAVIFDNQKTSGTFSLSGTLSEPKFGR
jgi:hypothetical protein